MTLLNRLQALPTQHNYGRYAQNPVGFIERELHCTLTDGQKAVAEAVRDYKVTVVPSANAVGKTHVAAGLAVWFLRTFTGSKIVTTAAPPLENLERLLWGEIGARLASAPQVFEGMTPGYLRVKAADDWWLVGRAIPGSGTSADRQAKFSGVHAPYMLFVVDEGDAVPEEVYAGIESCMSGGHVRLLILFNPRSPSGEVYRMIQQERAKVVELDAFSHPNVSSGRDVIPGAVTRAKTVLRISEWSRPWVEGEDQPRPDDPDWFRVPEFLDGATATRNNGSLTSPLVGGQWRKITNPALSHMVLARYPGQAATQLISRSWIAAAQQRWEVWREMHGDVPPLQVAPLMGVDPAEFGPDPNARCLRYGSWVAGFRIWKGVDILVTGDQAAEEAFDVGAQHVFVDATGVGSGVPPHIQRRWELLGYQGQVYPVKVAESPTAQPEEGIFGALRDQLWWRCREWLRTDPTAMLPPDEELAEELCAPQYAVQRGKIKVTDKDTLREVLKRSPNKADALCLTFADQVVEDAPRPTAVAAARVTEVSF